MSTTPARSRRNSAAGPATRTPAAAGAHLASSQKAQRTPAAQTAETPGHSRAWASQSHRSAFGGASSMGPGSAQMGASTNNASAAYPVPSVPLEPLDFSHMYANIDNFMVTFNAFISGELAAAEMWREEHESGMALDRDEIKTIELELEDAKKEQSGLWKTIETQKEVDAAERRDIGVLRSTQASLTSQRANLEGDLQELEKVSKAKAKAKEEKRNMLIMQRSKNVGELQRLYNLTGLEIRQHKIQDQLKFVYKLVNPDNFYEEYSFIMDISQRDGRNYAIHDLTPPIDSDKLAEFNAQLAKSRDPFEVVKAMRNEFKIIAEESRKRRRGLA